MADQARPMTTDEIYTKLGLNIPGTPDVFCGKTTHIIITALVALSRGKNVCFSAHTLYKAQFITREAKEYARQLGLDDGKILRPVCRQTTHYTRGPVGMVNTVMFDDHHYGYR